MDTEEQDKPWEAEVPVFHDVLAVELAAMITKVADSTDSPNPVVRVGNELIRLLLTDMPTLRAEYRRTLILALLAHIQDELYKSLDPNTLPNHMTGIDFNEDALKHVSRGRATRLVPGTVIERDYQGKTYVVFCREDYYEYDQKRYSSLTKIASEIVGFKFSGPLFFTRKSRMYAL